MLASTSFLARVSALGLFVVVGVSVQTDTTRHVYGYGGILPVPPAVTEGADEDMAPTPDILGQRRQTMRTEKGRVLYANERVSAPARTEATRPISSAPRAKRPCSQVVQTRANPSAAPNS